MARPKNEQLQADRREEILAAAARVFKRKGFHAARTEDICAEAGMSSGSVFRYFSSKQEIILAIATREYEFYRAIIRNISSKEGLIWLSQLDAAGLGTLLAPSDSGLGIDSWLELHRDPEWHERLLPSELEIRGLLAERLAEGQREGWVVPTVDCHGMAYLLCALFDGLMIDQEMDIPVHGEAMAATIARLVRGILHS